jgi:hypothetical protein
MADAAGGAAAASAAGVLSTAWKNAMATVGSAKLFQFVKSAPGGQSAPVVGDTVLSTYAGLVHIDTDDGKLVVTCAGLPLDTGGVCNKKTTISDGLTKVATSNLLNHLWAAQSRAASVLCFEGRSGCFGTREKSRELTVSDSELQSPHVPLDLASQSAADPRLNAADTDA